MDPATILMAINGLATLLRVLDELERRGAKLTPVQREQREQQRHNLNALWREHLALRRAKRIGHPVRD